MNMAMAILTTPSGESMIEVAAKRTSRLFAAYIIVLLIAAFFTWLVWDSGNTLQGMIRKNADARIAEAQHQTEVVAQANIGLRSDLNAQSAQVAVLQTEAANAKASQQRVETELMNAKTELANAKTAQQKVETELSRQQERAANAEHSLLQLKESLKDRTISVGQREGLIKLLTGGTQGSVEVWWLASDSDSYPLALQIIDILKKSGWTDVKERMAISGTGTGLFIAMRDTNNPLESAKLLDRAFFSIGMPLTHFPQTDIPIGVVRIYIGRKEQVH